MRLERESEEPYFQISYRAQNDQGALIVLSKTVVTVNQDMAFISGFRMSREPLFRASVRNKWGVLTKKAKAIKEGAAKGKIYSLHKNEAPWGYLFEGHAKPYIFSIVVSNLDGLDLTAFERIIRNHIKVVAELPPQVEPSDIALRNHSINLPSAKISVLSPGPLQKQPYVMSAEETSFLRNSQSYSFFGTHPPFELTINWSRLHEGQGPAYLAGGVRGGMSALAQTDGVKDLEYKVVETLVSGLEGLRISATFARHDQEMKYEAIFWAKGDEAWNLSTYLQAGDTKAQQAAIRIIESLQVSTK